MSYIREYSQLTPQEQRQLRYKRRYKEDVPSWDDSMVLLTNLVRERLGDKPTILDFGCGRGNFVLDELAGLCGQKIGFDVAHESVEGNVSNDELVIGKSEALPFPDAHFDIALSLWVFEHLEDPAAVLRELFRVLKPGGFLAFVTPHKHSALIRLRRLMTDGVAQQLLKYLYGREEKDVFEIFYRANAHRDIAELASATGFIAEVLTTNADPSYTSFNTPTYLASKGFTTSLPTLANPHVVAVLRKPA